MSAPATLPPNRSRVRRYWPAALVALLFVGGLALPIGAAHSSLRPLSTAGADPEVPITLSTTLQVSPATVAVGQMFELWANASGGVTPYTYLYQNLPTGCFTADQSTLTCAPNAVGTYGTTNVTVTDSGNGSATASVSIHVVADLVLGSSSASPTSPPSGGTFTYTISVSNGVPPYTAELNGFPSGCSGPGSTYSTTISVPCTVGSSGTYTVSVSVSDSDRETVSGNSFTISVSSNSNTNNGNNNNGNGNGNSNNNSNSSFNLGNLIPSWFFLALIAGAVLGLAGFVAIILTAVFTGITASRTKKMIKLLQAAGPAAAAPAAAATAGGTACGACGRTNPGDARFCLNCGKPLDGK